MKQSTAWLFLVAAALVTQVDAQQYVYPAKGQSPQQQNSDEAACYQWAVQQTGFDPTKPPLAQPAAEPTTMATGTTPGAGARGAVGGATICAIAGDAAAGAAAGAVVQAPAVGGRTPLLSSRHSSNSRPAPSSNRLDSPRPAPHASRARGTQSTDARVEGGDQEGRGA